VKTLWGWREKQLADGTLIVTSPAGQTFVTHPGSALLFPSLCLPTAELPAPPPLPLDDRRGQRTAMMPKRSRTRAQNRAAHIAAERRQNQRARQARRVDIYAEIFGPRPPSDGDDDPPPF
jgi:hypothetical protein